MRPLTGIALKLASVLLFVTMISLIKATSAHVPPGQAVFFRATFAIPVILAWLWLRGDLATGLRVSRPLGHVARSLFGTGAQGLYFAAVALLPRPEVTALNYTAPLLTVIFAALILGERVGLVRSGAVALGFAGVLVVLWPRLGGTAGQAGELLGAGLVLAGAACAAMAQIMIRQLVRTDQTSAIVFWFSCTAAALSLLTLPFGWVQPTGQEALFLVLAGVLGGLGQVLLTSAYRFADASVVAPFDYASMLLVVVVGIAVFGEMPTVPMLAGAALVIAAGIGIILRERQLGLRRARARAARTPRT
jgi:drug/metabolite transporter (DMT)-like permease